MVETMENRKKERQTKFFFFLYVVKDRNEKKRKMLKGKQNKKFRTYGKRMEECQ